MRRVAAVAVMLSAAVLAAAGPVGAQDSNQDLQKTVAELQERVKTLEQEAAKQPAAPAVKETEPKQLMAIDEDGIGVFERLFREAKVTGFVDVGYVWNFDRPANGLNGNSGDSALSTTPPGLVPAGDGGSIRAFDAKSRSFYLHNAQLDLSRAPDDKLIVGYDLELSFGSDANVFGTLDSNLGDFFDVQEANVQIAVPVGGKSVLVTAGKFATFAGMEVIESKDNWNYSRSLPFLFAIPFTHTGVRARYEITGEYNFTVGANNGWDRAVDNNDAKTFEFQFNAKPAPWLNAFVNIYNGAEKARAAGLGGGNERGDKRFLADFVVVVSELEALKGWSFAVNFDLGEEEEVVTDPITGELEDAEWTAFALYAKYKVNDWFTPGVRYSYFNDEDGYRTAIGTGAGVKDKKISEITLTGEFAVAASTIFRLEVRNDMSDEDIFLDGTKEDDSQTTLGAELIISF